MERLRAARRVPARYGARSLWIAPGDVPADFLARLVVDAFRSDPKVTPGDNLTREVPTDGYAENASDDAGLNREEGWFPGMDSNHHKQVQSLLSCR